MMIPMPPPTPRIEDTMPMLPATFSRGNSSRTIPKARGKTPPPAPWMTRPTIIGTSAVERAETSVPTASRPKRVEEQALLAVHVAEAAEDRGPH